MKIPSLDDRAYELERQESRMIMDGKAPDEIQREITRERAIQTCKDLLKRISK